MMKSVNDHKLAELALEFSVGVTERQYKLAKMHWLSKLQNQLYKVILVTTTELSTVYNYCLYADKSNVIRYCETVYERSNKIGFGIGQLKFLTRYLVTEV